MEIGDSPNLIAEILNLHLNYNKGNQKTVNRNALKEVEYRHIKKLDELLSSDWKNIMEQIDGTQDGKRRFTSKDIEAIESACEQKPASSCFEIFIKEWGTMQEWGINGKPANRMPDVTDLLEICKKIDNWSAASYINQTILGGEPLQREAGFINTEELEIYSNFDQRLEDIIESHAALRPDEQVQYFPHRYLMSMTNNFDERRRIGKGGFADVYKATTNTKQYEIAIKNMKRGVKGKGSVRLLFDNEIQHFPQLRHPNIIDLYGYSSDNPDEPCLIYPFLRHTLAEHLAKNNELPPLTATERLNISFGIAKAINHIHQQEVVENGKRKVLVHRDIKPQNILLDDKLEAKVADFDLLKFAATGDTISLTETKENMGSAAYMPPEAMRSDVSAKWDIWSFGVVLLELLTGLEAVNVKTYGHLKEHVESMASTQHTTSTTYSYTLDPLLSILNTCWIQEDEMGNSKLDAGRELYDLAMSRCLLERKEDRANSSELLKEIEKLVT